MKIAVNNPGSSALKFPSSLSYMETLVLNNTSSGRTGTMIKWTVPFRGIYIIEAWGAQGGSNAAQAGGRGARMKGEFFLETGAQLTILVGQRGAGGGSSSQDSGGGGGTFVTLGNDYGIATPLLIAGGGGGGSNGQNGRPGVITQAGGATFHPGGVDGKGAPGSNNGGGGGGGFFTNGGPSSSWGNVGGFAFRNGGLGGNTASAAHAIGGFGGGAGAHGNSYIGGGAGGGYSGGGAGSYNNNQTGGGGGGSYNIGANQDNASGVRLGDGLVEITFASPIHCLLKSNDEVFTYNNNEFSKISEINRENFETMGGNLLELTQAVDKERKTLKEKYVNGNRFFATSMLPETWDRQISNIVAEAISPSLFLMETRDSIKSIHSNALVMFNKATADTRDDFEVRAMDSFSGWQTPITRVDYEADVVSIFADGWVIKKEFTNDEKMIRIQASDIAGGSKFLIKSLDRFYGLSQEGEWNEVNLTGSLSKELIIEHGTDKLGEISSTKWKELGATFEVYTWVDDWKFVETVTEAEKQIVNTGTLFKTELNDFSKINNFSFES